MPTIKAADLAYVRVRVPALDRAERFFTDFGLQRAERTGNALYMRGSGSPHHVHVAELGDPKFMSIAFSVTDEEDLHALSLLPSASKVEPIEEPGGGKRVWLQDPDGNAVEVVHGVAAVSPIEHARHPLNDAQEGLRRAGVLSRHVKGPSKVLRIGHGVLMSANPRPVADWYREALGLLCSDEVFDPQGNLVLCFNRLDKGAEYVDHHVLLIQGGPRRGLNHVAFEVHDIDDLMVGHEHLQAAGYYNIWGIGRHVYGAQVFDYWMDPWDFMYEHWTDTDRLNASFKGVLDGTIESANGPWGAAVPERFFTHAHD